MIPVTFDTVATLQFGSPDQSALRHPGRVENLQNQTPPAAQQR